MNASNFQIIMGPPRGYHVVITRAYTKKQLEINNNNNIIYFFDSTAKSLCCQQHGRYKSVNRYKQQSQHNNQVCKH